MKVVINDKNNICILQTTSKTLFCYCSLVVEIFQQFRHIESCVKNFSVPMKYVINGKNNKNICQTTRRALFYHCSWAAELFQQLMHIENCVRNVFVPITVLINRKSNLCILQTTSKTLFCYTLLVVKIFQKIGRLENCVRKTFLHSVTVWNQLVVWKISGFWQSNKTSACSYGIKTPFKKSFLPWLYRVIVPIINRKIWVFGLSVI